MLGRASHKIGVIFMLGRASHKIEKRDFIS
jgi:hypothetical protein